MLLNHSLGSINCKNIAHFFITDKIDNKRRGFTILKKIFLIACILVSCLFCTACINNLAISELNQMGIEYLQKGDYDNAIARFKSSVDLDENVFESRYNLGVAYVNKEEYKNAIPQLEAAVKLRPDSKDAIYSYAVALESEGLKFEKDFLDDISESEAEAENQEKAEIKIARDDVVEGLILIEAAISNYSKYIELTDNADEKSKVKAHINDLNKTVNMNKEEYKITDDELTVQSNE